MFGTKRVEEKNDPQNLTEYGRCEMKILEGTGHQIISVTVQVTTPEYFTWLAVRQFIIYV
jgi:hypothetical protein